jgi:hypothetical protein
VSSVPLFIFCRSILQQISANHLTRERLKIQLTTQNALNYFASPTSHLERITKLGMTWSRLQHGQLRHKQIFGNIREAGT